ncbi:hypothetical protein [Providencia manganoxydans]|uniref:hypothetical protein n=1 Tax=Providencia manganoxydans TaxID=2923283 RepID=UPI0034E56A25
MGSGGKGGGSKKQTVGYRYYWDIQAGLGRGPVDEIVAISADKKTVFAGTAGQISENTSVYIDKPNLFGGDDTGGEGGIRGTLDISMGEQNQVPTERLRKLLTGLVPGFRGLVTTLFSGMVSSYAASPKPWSYRVRRTVKGWDGATWYPEKALIKLSNMESQLDDEDSLTPEQINNIRTIHAMNAAHILVECATNRDWGRKLTLADLDLVSYQVAADTLYKEGFGLCLRYNRQTSLDNFVQQILDHIGAVQYGDLSTGKLVLKLLRDDYRIDDLPLFTYDNGIIDVQDDDSTSADAAPNELVVTWHCPVTHADGEVKAQNLGAIQSVGLISSSVEYMGIPTHKLATQVAQRDLEAGSSGLTRLVLDFDRRGGVLSPASVFRIHLPDRNIDRMVLRVGSIEERDDGRLKIKAVQDVFGLPATSYSSGDQGSTWVPPDATAQPITDSQAFEVPYVLLAGELSAADLDYLHAASSYLSVMAAKPNNMAISYLLQTQSEGLDWQTVGENDWTPSGILRQAVNALDTVLSIESNFIPPVGSAVWLGDELVRVDAVNETEKTLMVGRGCGDTLPVHHNGGTVLRFLSQGLEGSAQEYLETENLNWRLLTKTSTETLKTDYAQVSTLMFTGRQSRPYLPARIMMNDQLYPITVTKANEYVLSWAHRDRVLQQDRLIDCLMADIGPEPETQYHLTLTPQGAAEPSWQIEVTDNHMTLPYTTDTTSKKAEAHYLQLWVERQGRRSLATFTTLLPVGLIVTEPELPEEPIEPEVTDV